MKYAMDVKVNLKPVLAIWYTLTGGKALAG